MPAFSGSFFGRITAQTAMSLTDQPNHDMSLAQVTGTQKSPDENWNNATVAYWAVTDLSGGQGTQRGYYDNVHPDGDRDFGTFEGQVSISGGVMTVEGTWKATDGTGKYKGVTANGTFRTRALSPTEVECSWQGAYELAAAKAAR